MKSIRWACNRAFVYVFLHSIFIFECRIGYFSEPFHVRFFVSLYCFLSVCLIMRVFFPFVVLLHLARPTFCAFWGFLFLPMSIFLMLASCFRLFLFFFLFVNKQIYWIKLQIIAIFPHSYSCVCLFLTMLLAYIYNSKRTLVVTRTTKNTRESS